MNIARLSDAAEAADLSDHDLAELIAAAQSVPVETVQDADGALREVYGTDPEADQAMALLIHGFRHLINSVARKYTSHSSDRMTFEDAQGYLYETFISTVRRFVPGSSLPFKAALRTVLDRRLDDEVRTSGLVAVRENVAARYRQLMNAHDRDAAAVYELCKRGETGMAAETFMAAHAALSRVESMDVQFTHGEETTDADWSWDLAASEPLRQHDRPSDYGQSPEDITVQAEVVRYLFGLVSDTQGSILRLRYGFNDLITENLRVTAGFRSEGADLVMSDREVAQCLGSTRPTVARQRELALGVMRTALEEVEAA